ncbi:hypothetical protein PEBR_21932 [Penicillium brasilianum]|uniref:Major facilitator superfamily (MFS) profile domain-containing protein n=1 Tax=Penicillium brasilianum TaxID=104259 RepID=A0A1S9RLF6_PENBI|nr:hypothetical protein PEBR_21932 [Penicillium brasilianum]
MAKQTSSNKTLPMTEHIETHQKGSSSAETTEIIYDDAEVRRIKRKVDIRLCIVIAVMYTVCQIDRNNLANAVVAGMGKDIDLTGNHYACLSTIVVIFFPFYTLFQPPMTIIARRIGPRLFLSMITVAWGIIMVGFGFVKDWQGLVGLRAALGLLEAGFFPTCVFLISSWYVRHETAKRIALFFLLGSAISGFGGILAYGLQKMHGMAGKAGWRWIFILEGTLTVVVGLLGFILIVDFPEDARQTRRFLTDREIDIMMDRVEKDRGDAHVTPFAFKEYLGNARDWKGWMFALNFCMTTVVNYAIAYFLPIILNEGLGFSVAAAQSLTAPCYLFATVLGLAESWLSDKYKTRGLFISVNALVQIVGISILGFAKQSSIRYFGAFVLVGGCNANIPASLTYQSNNIVGQWRRAFGSALIVGSGGVGGVVGSLVFRNQDKPAYKPGLYTCFAAASITLVSVLITTVAMARMNKRQKENKIVILDTPGFRAPHERLGYGVRLMPHKASNNIRSLDTFFRYHGIPFFSDSGRECLTSRYGHSNSLTALFTMGLPWERKPGDQARFGTGIMYPTSEASDILPDRFITEACKSFYQHGKIGLIYPIVDPTTLDTSIDKAYGGGEDSSNKKALVLAFVAFCSNAGHREQMSYPVDGEKHALQAETLLGKDKNGVPSLDALQTSVFLALYYFSQGSLQNARRLIGLASSLVNDLCPVYNFTSSPSKLPLNEIHCSTARQETIFRLLFWVVLMVDNDLSFRVGAPPLFQVQSILHLEPLSPSDPNPLHLLQLLPAQEPAPPENIYCHIFSLSLIWSRVYTELFAPLAESKSDIEILQSIRVLDDTLENWRMSIPSTIRPTLHPSISTAKPPNDRPLLLLNLKYHHCLGCIHQVPIFTGAIALPNARTSQGKLLGSFFLSSVSNFDCSVQDYYQPKGYPESNVTECSSGHAEFFPEDGYSASNRGGASAPTFNDRF